MRTFLTIVVLAASTLGMIGRSGYSEAEARLVLAVAHFENAEANFSGSATMDQLIVNAGRVDRMAAAIREVDTISSSDPETTDAIRQIRSELLQRYAQRRSSLESDASYLNAMHQLELMNVWLQ